MNTKTSYRGRRTAALAVLAACGAGAAVVAVTATSSATTAYGAVTPGGIGAAPDKTVASVIAPDGDRDPFGIAIVPLTMGNLTAGNLLVAEFGDRHGTAGAGTTILQGVRQARDQLPAPAPASDARRSCRASGLTSSPWLGSSSGSQQSRDGRLGLGRGGQHRRQPGDRR